MMNEALSSAPLVITEMTAEFLRRGAEEYRKDSTSQVTACFHLAIRSASLLHGMGKLLTPRTWDSLEVLTRGFLEARDLLMTFRFDQKGTRDKIAYWFKGDSGNSWKAEHEKCEEYMATLGHIGVRLGAKWSQMTTLAHPTFFAAWNSVATAVDRHQAKELDEGMQLKNADYLASIATLITAATTDFPGLIALGCDLNHLPNIDSFQANVATVVRPILEKKDSDLPRGSYRA